MGTDWEQILGTTGTGIEQAYDDAVSRVIYSSEPSSHSLVLDAVLDEV